MYLYAFDYILLRNIKKIDITFKIPACRSNTYCVFIICP